jgi:transcriptional regulator with XRE-family HTH domain
MELNNIKTLRKTRKVSIKDLSKITGINRDRISLIERNKVNPSYATVESIVTALNAKIILIPTENL